MHKKVHQAIDHSHYITLLLKPIVPQSLPKVASSATSETYTNDVETNDSASESKPSLIEVLASYPCPTTPSFIAVSQTFFSPFRSQNNAITQYYMKRNHGLMFRTNVSSAEHRGILYVIHICT